METGRIFKKNSERPDLLVQVGQVVIREQAAAQPDEDPGKTDRASRAQPGESPSAMHSIDLRVANAARLNTPSMTDAPISPQPIF